ncbi:MAG: acyl--CoA ligase [Thermaerobacter sp.]|nr:acyl--CoA ligase [Thermaerobacter sp.]
MARWNFGRDVMDGWAASNPEGSALYVLRDRAHADTVSFAQLQVVTNRLVSRFRQAGVQAQDRVMVVVGKDPAFWPIMVALIKLGAVPMPGTTQLTPRDIRYRLALSDAHLVIVNSETAARVAADPDVSAAIRVGWVVGGESPTPAWSRLDPFHEELGDPDDGGNPTDEGDPCLLYFTSGTTGHPKMVLHNETYPRAHRVTGDWLGVRPGDIHWNLSDTGWAKAAWSSLFGPWMAGATVVVDPMAGRFDAREMLEYLAGHPITSICAAPTIYRMLVQEDLSQYALPHLTSAVGAGEPLNPEVIDAFRRATGLTIRDGYGQTETVLLVGNRPGVPVKPGSMGQPSAGFDVDVIDEAGERLPADREGDIAVWMGDAPPEGLYQGYWRDDAETASRRRGPWYVTGDRAMRDRDGYLWFVGRADDVILSAGYRIGPFEVESALVEHPAVMEAAVVSSPDAIRGEIVKAFVILAPGVEPSEALVADLQEHVKAVTAPYKYPRAIDFVAELPKTISGKIRRVELRDREWGREPPTP